MAGYDLRELYTSALNHTNDLCGLAQMAREFPPLYADQVAALQDKQKSMSATHALDTVTIWWYSFLCDIHNHIICALATGNDDIIERAMEMHSLNVKCVAHNNTAETAHAIRLICFW